MSKVRQLVRIGFLYIALFLNPIRLLRAGRVLYFSAPQRNSTGDDSASVPVPLLVLQNIAIVGIVSAIAHYLLRKAGQQFSWVTALRVIVGYALLAAIFFLWSFVRPLIRGDMTGEKKSRGAWGPYFYLFMPAPLLGACVAGISGNLLLGTVVAGGELALWPVMLMASPVAQRALFGCAYGMAVGLLAFGLGRVGLLPLRLWLYEMLFACGGAIGLILIMLGAFVVMRPLLRGLTPRGDYVLSILTMYAASLGFASLLSLAMGLLKQSAPSRLTLALASGFIVSRLPLWPIEALWAWLWCPIAWRRARKQLATQTRIPLYNANQTSGLKYSYRRAIRSTYFDRRQMVPLPGEVESLISLGKLDVTLACEEAIELLNLSPRMHTAGHALRALAQQSPILAHRPIAAFARTRKEFQSLPVWIGAGLTGTAAPVWKALEALRALALAERLQALSPVTAESPGAKLPTSAPARALYEERTAALIATCRDALAVLLEDLQRAASSPDAPAGTALLADFIQQSTRELTNLRWDGVAAIHIDKKLLARLATDLCPKSVYENLAGRLVSENWLADAVESLKKTTSPLKRRNQFLNLLTQMQTGDLFFLTSITFAGLTDNILESELKLTLSIVQLHWRGLVMAEARRLANEKPIGSIEIPYVLGQPVRGSLFIGREDLFQHLRSMWGDQQQWSSVLLHGHRRMGKSSILHNLPSLFEGRSVIVANFNMQSLGEIEGTVEFLRALAREIWRAAKTPIPGLSEPDSAAFALPGGYEAFREYLYQFAEQRNGYRLIITIDEYEHIDQYLQQGLVEERLLEFLRALLDCHTWLCVVFAGLHTHNELNGDHWQHLFRTVTPIRVSFLKPPAAHRLLTEPTPDFPVSFDEEVLHRTYQLTSGQPFLLQLVGYSLMRQLNSQRQTDPSAPLRFSMSDLDQVLADQDFYPGGAPYFEGVRRQVAVDFPSAAVVLNALSASENGLDAASLQAAAGLADQEYRTAIELLVNHEVVEVDGKGRFRFAVELMRRFVARLSPVSD